MLLLHVAHNHIGNSSMQQQQPTIMLLYHAHTLTLWLMPGELSKGFFRSVNDRM